VDRRPIPLVAPLHAAPDAAAQRPYQEQYQDAPLKIEYCSFLPNRYNRLSMDILNLTSAQLKHAADIKEQIAALEEELKSIIDGSNGVPAPFRTRRNNVSAAGRARIAAAQRARWAKFRGVKGASGRAKGAKTRTMSAAAKAKIAAAARARWAKAKAAGKNSL